MSILLSNEIIGALKKELNLAQDSVQIITAYCKDNAIRNINSYINDVVAEKRIMLRFRMDDLLKGSSDLSVARFCLDNGWKVFVRFDLHAKTYIVDNKRGIVASANTTNSGMGFGKRSNLEVGTLVDIEPSDINKILGLYIDAIELNCELLSEMEKQINAVQETKQVGSSYEWGTNISKLFQPEITTLFSHEIPENNISENGYVGFLDQDFQCDITALRNAFRWSNVYLWLLSTLKQNDNCLFFGALSAKMHDALIEDPKPFRKDVKEHLSNLLNLVEQLQMDEVLIDRPKHSQRVRLVATQPQ